MKDSSVSKISPKFAAKLSHYRLKALLEHKDFCAAWLDKACDFLEEELPEGADKIVEDLERKWGRPFRGTVLEKLNSCLRETKLYARLGEPPLPPEIDSLAQNTAQYRQNPFDALSRKIVSINKANGNEMEVKKKGGFR